MFNRNLLAAGIMLASSLGHAASWQDTHTTIEHTDEGIEGMAVGAGVPTVSGFVQLGASYAVNDQITFTLNQPKATNSAWPTNLYTNKGPAAISGANALEIDGAGFAVGDTAIVVSNTGGIAGDIATMVVGTQFKIEGDSTLYLITTMANSGVNLSITPALVKAGATLDNKDITTFDPHSFTLDYLDGTTTAATYRVAATPTGGSSTIGALLQTPAVNVTPAGLIAQDAKLSFSAATAAGTAMDALASTLTIAQSSPTYKQTVTKFNGTIDVEQGRLAFKGGSATSGGDTLTIATTTDLGTQGVTSVNSATYVSTLTGTVNQTATTQGGVVHTITGDVSWLDTAAATAGIQTTGVTSTGGTTTPVIDTAGSKITLTDASAVAASTTLTIAKTAAAAAIVIPETTFTGTSVYSYTSVTAKTKTVTNAWGGFTLNGASVTAYGVPMGSTVSRFLWVNNKGAIPATVTAQVVAGGTSYGPYVLGTAAAKSAMSLGSALDSALTNAGVVLSDNSRANVTFTSPVKAADVTVSAAYKHIADADRLTIETSDTVVGQITCTGTGTSSANALTGSQVAAAAAITSQGVAAGTATSADTCSNAK